MNQMNNKDVEIGGASHTATTAFILPLSDASAGLSQVGGKGASLGRMAAAGLPVPPGFYITTAAYRRFVEENGLQEQILEAISTVGGTSQDRRDRADRWRKAHRLQRLSAATARLEEASRQIGGLFARGVIPDDIAEAIRRAYAELGGGNLPVAVRSSATAEDLPEMSFAGQQETYLNMHGEAMVLDAVKRCWASLWTARAIDYRARHNIAQESVSLAVVVQELVPADAAGILFTANPVTGARDQVIINAAWGLGEAIVGGQVTPDTVVVDKASGAITKQEITEKDVMTVRTEVGTREEPVPAEQRKQAVLSPEQTAELARIGVQIEDLYGQPMDIEWALYNGRVSIVQARPITALPEPAAEAQAIEKAEWKLPNPKGKYWRASVVELLPEPLSPLFASLGLPAWSRTTEELMKSVGMKGMISDDVLTTLNGYAYYGMILSAVEMTKMALLMPRFIAILIPYLRTARTRWQEQRSKYAEVVNRWQTMDLATTLAEDLLSGAREVTSEAAQYYLSVQSGILPAAYMSEWFFTLAYNKLLKRRNAPPALTFVLGFDSTPIRAEQSLYDLAQWVREQPELAAELAKMSGEQFTAAYRVGAGLAPAHGAWPEFWQLLTDHLARFGHAIYDLDFAKALLADDPAPALETLKFFLSGEAPDPYARQAAARTAREQATQTMLKQLRGPRLKLFRSLVGVAQRFAPLREDALVDVGLGWPILRRMLREIGRRLTEAGMIDTPDDVFWLTLDELQEAATALDAGQPLTNKRALIAERHTTWESRRALIPPVVLPPKSGARFWGIDFSSMMPARADQAAGNVIKGVGASPGRITGTARVIHGPEDFGQMRQGDILVTKITTPAWTPLFALASGVVTDVGGPLSHSSIVAREYHIPAVLGTGVATARLHSGQHITVDGDAGQVSLSKAVTE